MHVVIIGNGVAGITAARTIRELSDHAVTVIADEAPYHFSRPAMMYVSLGQLEREHIKPYRDEEWEKLDIKLVHGACIRIDTQTRVCMLADGSSIQADVIVLATGSEPCGHPVAIGRHRKVLTYTRLSDIDELALAMQSTNRAAVIGGGLIGAEVSEVLIRNRIRTTWYIREEGVYASHLPHEETQMITDHVRRHGVDVRTHAEISCDEDLDDADLVVVAIGMQPAVRLAVESGIVCRNGILVTERFATSCDNVYAIGDCAEMHCGARQGWYVGREHGTQLAHILCERTSSYAPALSFNSAKFFDLEWQVYGSMPATTEKSIMWRGNGAEWLLRIAYNHDGIVIGVHAVGMRLRHEVCREWIEQRWHVDTVRTVIDTALFEPQLSVKRVI